MNLFEYLTNGTGGTRQVLLKMSSYAAEAQGLPEVILTHDPGTFKMGTNMLAMADFVYARNDERKWICIKNRETGITGVEPERWQMAQWLLEAKQI